MSIVETADSFPLLLALHILLTLSSLQIHRPMSHHQFYHLLLMSPPSLDLSIILSPSPPDLSPSPSPDWSSSPALSWQPSLSSLSEEESDDDEGLSLPTVSTNTHFSMYISVSIITCMFYTGVNTRETAKKMQKKTREINFEDVGRTSRWRRTMKNKH